MRGLGAVQIARAIGEISAEGAQHPAQNVGRLVLVTRYLQRDLCRALGETLTADGVIVYETFTEAQRRLGKGPTSPDHLLQPGELRRAFSDLDVMFYEEVFAPEAVARLVARRR